MRPGSPCRRSICCAPASTKRWPASSMCSVKLFELIAYLFVNKRANRMKVLVHDGFSVLWLCARKLYEGSFIRAGVRHDRGMQLSHEQLQAIVVGLPWERDSMSARRSGYCEKKSTQK